MRRPATPPAPLASLALSPLASLALPLATILMLALGLAVPTAARAQFFPADDDLRLMLRYLVEDGEAPAVALGVLEPDGSTRVIAYGNAGRDTPGQSGSGGSIGPDAVFALGELTMPFTATLLAEMAARGEVALNDPVARYLPEGVTVPSLSGYEITLEHLARHRSGLPAEPPEAYDDFTLDDLYAFLGRYELDWVPGRRREPSALGYGLLGHALARAAGMPLPELLRERVLEPLGMRSTGYGESAAVDEDAGGPLVVGHEAGRVVAYPVPTEALQGAAGLRSSIEDMGRFLRANATAAGASAGAASAHDVHSDRSDQTGQAGAVAALQQAMAVTHEVRSANDPEGEGWGWSWRTYTEARQPLLVTHGGRAPGFSALLSFDPARRIGTVLLAAAGDFNDWLARDLLYTDPPVGRPRVEVDPSVLARYVGTYGGRGDRYRARPNTGSIYIRLDSAGRLTYQPGDRVRTPLLAESDSSFYMLRGPYTVAFDRVADDVEMTVTIDAREPRLRGESWRSWRLSAETPPAAVVAGNTPARTTWGAGRWLLLGLAGGIALALILRPLWPRSRRAR